LVEDVLTHLSALASKLLFFFFFSCTKLRRSKKESNIVIFKRTIANFPVKSHIPTLVQFDKDEEKFHGLILHVVFFFKVFQEHPHNRNVFELLSM